ncbi:hypothetical protein EYF80_052208 [Liparis tanakae]|uniref:Uncharacterized protein n=1 Tax=Liparis tanakae TaxID=230148 RepID=A0A4Z2F9Q8_9TELE|nr:hypothetical protein EYF80_052208 [Liparis tanakae]
MPGFDLFNQTQIKREETTRSSTAPRWLVGVGLSQSHVLGDGDYVRGVITRTPGAPDRHPVQPH